MTKINVSSKSSDRKFSTDYDFGADLPAMVKLFSDKVVHANAEDSMTIALQGFIRSRLVRTGEDAMTDAQIKADIATWKPGARTITRDPVAAKAKLVSSLNRLTAEERAELIKTMQATMPAVVKGGARAARR